MPFVRSGNRDIYYECQGSGPAMLFLHGAGSNAATWWQQLPVFSKDHRCVTMDIRCFGRSVAPTSEFALPLFVDDVLAVLDALGIERATVVGQSLGGMIGLRLALDHPNRVAAFVATDTTLGIDHPVLLDRLERRNVTQAGASIEQRALGAWFLREQPALAALYAQINHFNPSAHRIPAEEWRAALASLLQAEKLTPLAGVSTLRCPTLFVVGSEDPLVPVSVMHEMATLVPASEVVVIDQAGHSAYFEKAAQFNQHVADFIGRRALWSGLL
jgi:pimeloyl-ACP methyl ester carboxylesterase